MKSFFLPVGKAAGSSLTTVLSALSCGAAAPVSCLDILYLADSDADPVIPALVDDLNNARAFLAGVENDAFFPSSFIYETLRPVLPDFRRLSESPAASSLLSALRGKGAPLSCKTDREAVEWAFSCLLSDKDKSLAPLFSWLDRLPADGKDARIALLCDLCDPFSTGVSFSLLRWFRESLSLPASMVSLFCIAERRTPPADAEKENLSSSLRSLDRLRLIASPGGVHPACADSVWLIALPSSLVRSEEANRLAYAVLARRLASFWTADKTPAPGLHTVEVPGILTFSSLDDRGAPFAAFLHTAIWLISDLLPALSSFFDHPGALRSLAPNTRNGLYRRLFRDSREQKPESLSLISRVLRAVLSEFISLIHGLPDSFRDAEISDALWKKATEACGRTVTVAAEYDVSLAEAEEAGIMEIKPVHRVSLSDTDEEKQLRRLDDISAQLKEETALRDQALAEIGISGFTALRNCRSRCEEALARARESVAELSADSSAGNLALAAAMRRVRLLEAAVSRCNQDLGSHELFSRIFSAAPAPASDISPFASCFLSDAAAEKLFTLLTVGEEDAEVLRRELRSLQPGLFPGFTLSDSKTLLRSLLSVCKPDPSLDPLQTLLRGVHSVSRTEIASLRFHSVGQLPPVPLLPDLYPDRPPVTVSSLLPLLPAVPDASGSSEEKRGLLSMLLLRQYRRRTAEESEVSQDLFHTGDSPVLRAWLAGRESDLVRILYLGSGENRLPFALVLPGRDFLPARLTPAHFDLIPSFAAPWADSENRKFLDPIPFLSQGDREILMDRLDRLLEALPSSSPMVPFLVDFLRALKSEVVSLPENLPLLLRAAFGLRLLPAFADTLVRTASFYEHFLPEDTVLSALTGQSAFPSFACNVPDDIVYLYRKVPFARENSRTLLSFIPLPARDWILNLLNQDCQTLSSSSDLYRDALVRELSLLLERYPDALPEARQTALDLLDTANKPLSDSVTELTWPWDPESPSIRTILSESLGDDLSVHALQPFSDCLALFPARGNEIIGDTLLSSMCLLNPESAPSGDAESAILQADAVLPPLSGTLMSAFCRLPEGRVLLRPGLLSFTRSGEGAIRVTLILDGRFPVRMIRKYVGEEILNLYAHEIPTLAVWPNLPFAPEDWLAYYTYSNFPVDFSMTLTSVDGSEIPVAGDGRSVSRTESFPLSFAFFRGGRSVGALPNLLPKPEIHKGDEVTACIDFGSAGTSVVLSSGRQRRPLQGPTLVRTLLNNPSSSRDLLQREFLPAVPVSALLPTASRIFRNVPGADPLPFEDGIVLMSAGMQDALSFPAGSLYTCLKWEEDKGRSVSLCLHQIMLMTALQARSDGASNLSWRFAVPDEMAREGRRKLADLFTRLAGKVNSAAGFSTPANLPLVSFAAESSALGAYFRLCSSEDTRGGFMVLDVGACTADISLFLRGREQAVRTCQIPLGIHYMLLPELLRDPSLLRRELSFVQDPSFQQDLLLMEQILNEARSDSSALRKARLALDQFIADRRSLLLPSLLWNPAAGMPTRPGAILLLHFSYLMMLSGLILMQIAADPGKNDFLPEQMSLCLSGRGSILMDDLPDPVKTSLWHFLTMFRNRRVASLSLLFSSEKKMEIAVGLSVLDSVTPDLPPASAVPAAVSVRPEELLPQFLLRFRKEFPAAAELLFGGFYTNDFYHPFTPLGESAVSAAISQSFTEHTALRPFDALSGWISSLMELISVRP